jgi:hypothetical protein
MFGAVVGYLAIRFFAGVAGWRFGFSVTASARTASSNDSGDNEVGLDLVARRLDSLSVVIASLLSCSDFSRDNRTWLRTVLERDRKRDGFVSAVPTFCGMSDTPEFTDLVNRLRALLDSEYRRGKADATRRIMEAAQVEVSPSSDHAHLNGTDSPKRHRVRLDDAGDESGAPLRRAPVGAPDALVRRVLIERGRQGASSREIEAAAHSEVEKMVSQSGIRFVLDRGRAAGKYRNEHGRWFLVEDTKD